VPYFLVLFALGQVEARVPIAPPPGCMPVCDAGYGRTVSCAWSDAGMRVRLAERPREPIRVKVTPVCR
jgi:hypothetical protein